MVGLILTYVSPLCCFGMFSIFHLVSYYNIRTSCNFSSTGLAWSSLEVVLDTISEIHDEAAAAFSALDPESGRATRTDHTRAAPARNPRTRLVSRSPPSKPLPTTRSAPRHAMRTYVRYHYQTCSGGRRLDDTHRRPGPCGC